MKKQTAASATSVALPRVVAENIDELITSRQTRETTAKWSVRAAEKISRFSGSEECLWFHAAWFALWIAINLNWIPGLRAFDSFPFGLLTMIVSLEAIFLSTILLIPQNRLQDDADRRSELDLHVNLLSERELTTILRKLARIEEALNIEVDQKEKHHVDELIQDVNPVDIVSMIERSTEKRFGRDCGKRTT